MKFGFHLVGAAAIGLVAVLGQTAHAECPPNRAVAGVIVDTKGVRMLIHRAAGPMTPREMDVICDGDIVEIETERSYIKVRMAGSSLPSTLVGPMKKPIAAYSPTPSFVDNAYAVALGRLMPGLSTKREHALARSGKNETFWNAPGLTEGTALLASGRRELVLGWTAAAANYMLEVREGATGARTTVSATNNDVVVPARIWRPGVYHVSLYRADEPSAPLLAGSFRVVSDEPPPPPPATPAWAGAELAAATHALLLIETDPARYGLEALQIIESSPREGLDRSVVYDAIRGANRR